MDRTALTQAAGPKRLPAFGPALLRTIVNAINDGVSPEQARAQFSLITRDKHELDRATSFYTKLQQLTHTERQPGVAAKGVNE